MVLCQGSPISPGSTHSPLWQTNANRGQGISTMAGSPPLQRYSAILHSLPLQPCTGTLSWVQWSSPTHPLCCTYPLIRTLLPLSVSSQTLTRSVTAAPEGPTQLRIKPPSARMVTPRKMNSIFIGSTSIMVCCTVVVSLFFFRQCVCSTCSCLHSPDSRPRGPGCQGWWWHRMV